ncbi:hypothetical protein HK098_000436 [Nowakowskiella sp. JEL0407]|nr:hypothetical protein HK098_000436 [Nowakowskiella sp. JEL0407]
MMGEEKEHTRKSPFLIRTWCQLNSVFRDDDFVPSRSFPSGELALHAWSDSTLRDLCSQLADQFPTISNYSSRIHFRLICHNQISRFVPGSTNPASHPLHFRDLGKISNSQYNENEVEKKSLAEFNFRIGDFLSIAIFDHNGGSAGTAGTALGGMRGGRDSGPMRRGRDARDVRDSGKFHPYERSFNHGKARGLMEDANNGRDHGARRGGDMYRRDSYRGGQGSSYRR